MSYCVLSRNAMSVVSCRVVSCHLMLCVLFHVTLFHVMSVKLCISHYVPLLCLNILGTTNIFYLSILLLISSSNMLHYVTSHVLSCNHKCHVGNLMIPHLVLCHAISVSCHCDLLYPKYGEPFLCVDILCCESFLSLTGYNSFFVQEV